MLHSLENRLLSADARFSCFFLQKKKPFSEVIFFFLRLGNFIFSSWASWVLTARFGVFVRLDLALDKLHRLDSAIFLRVIVAGLTKCFFFFFLKFGFLTKLGLELSAPKSRDPLRLQRRFSQLLRRIARFLRPQDA